VAEAERLDAAELGVPTVDTEGLTADAVVARVLAATGLGA
jgi:hypothetical protein